MKCAVCLSGLTRSLWYSFPILNEYLIKRLNADIFLHTWDTDGSDASCYYMDKIDFVTNIIRPTDFIIENYSQFSDIYGTTSTPAMYYSIQQSNKLKTNNEIKNNIIYDIVFRIRMDCFFDNIIDINELNSAMNDNILYVAWHSHADKYPHQIITDMFSFASSKIMDIYSSSFETWENNKHLKNEQVIDKVLKDNNIKTQWSNIRFKLGRQPHRINKIIIAYGYCE